MEKIILDLAIERLAFIGKQRISGGVRENPEPRQPGFGRGPNRTRRDIEMNRLWGTRARNRLPHDELAWVDQRQVMIEVDPAHEITRLAGRDRDLHRAAIGPVGPVQDV